MTGSGVLGSLRAVVLEVAALALSVALGATAGEDGATTVVGVSRESRLSFGLLFKSSI